MASIGQNNKVVSLSDNNHNRGGGEPPMKNDYVTHEELDHSVDKLGTKMDLMEAHIDTKFEQVNTKFANMKVWFVLTAISIIAATTGLIAYFK